MHRVPRPAGYIADLPTPFHDNGTIDMTSFVRLCERQIDAGASAIVVAETAGEAPTLTTGEHQAIVRAAVSTSRGRISVIAGAGSNSTSHAIELTKQAEASGADAILSVVPYYNKPMQAGLLAHFQAIAGSTQLPIILHDVPTRTVRELSDETVAQLSKSCQFIGIKDSTGDMTRPLRLRSMVRPEFLLLSGDDATAAGYLMQGGHGCISLTSNVVPELCRRVYASCLRGELQTASEIGGRLAPLTEALSQGSTPSALKYALSLLGLMSPCVRLPIVEPAESSKAPIARTIAAICDQDDAFPGLNGLHRRTPRSILAPALR
jgi:4-hydroxy-tetrahydrodipicolinate synthase